MQEQLISLETAKLAKAQGFDISQRIITITFDKNERFEEDTHGITQSLLQKWLREKYNIDIEIRISISENNYYILLLKDKLPLNIKLASCYTYEEALEVGLYKALLLIKS